MRYKYKEFKKVSTSESEIAEVIGSFDRPAQYRVLKIAKLFEQRLANYKTRTSNTTRNPLLLGAFASRKDFEDISALKGMLQQHDEFSGLETILGTVHEEITEIYGWERVISGSHSPLSEIDCSKQISDDTVSLVTMKSGPYCINDTIANRIGSSVAEHCMDWSNHWGTKKIEFTVGIVYATPHKSNKKNWHTIRIAEEKLSAQGARIIQSCVQDKEASPLFYAQFRDVQLVVRTLQGIDLWDLVSRPHKNAYLEICCALTKCVKNNKRVGHNTVKDWVHLFVEGFVDSISELQWPTEMAH